MLFELQTKFAEGSFMLANEHVVDQNEDWKWKCFMCGTVSHEDVLLCPICSSPPHPKWLYIENGKTKLTIGMRVCIRGELENRFGVLVAVNVLKAQLTFSIVSKKLNGEIEFKSVVLYGVQLDAVERLNVGSPYNRIIDRHGMCPTCQQSFRVINWAQVNSHGLAWEDPKNIKDDLNDLQNRLKVEELKKAKLKLRQDTDAVLESTRVIMELKRNILDCANKLEKCCTFCPHCGWSKFD